MLWLGGVTSLHVVVDGGEWWTRAAGWRSGSGGWVVEFGSVSGLTLKRVDDVSIGSQQDVAIQHPYRDIEGHCLPSVRTSPLPIHKKGAFISRQKGFLAPRSVPDPARSNPPLVITRKNCLDPPRLLVVIITASLVCVGKTE